MNRHITTLLAASALLAATAAMAQEYPVEETTAYAEGVAVATETAQSVIAPLLEDQGEEIALAAQAANVSIPPKPEVTAMDAVTNDLNNHGLHTGYDKEKDVIIGTAFAAFKSPNPAEDPDFIDKRDLAAMEAYLKARASVGRQIAQIFKAEARSGLVPNDDPSPLAKAKEAKQKEVEEMKANLTKKLAELDAVEAEALKGVTIIDRLDAALDAIIKKLDSSYDPAVISAEKMDRYNALKAEAAQLKLAYKELGEATEAAFPKVRSESKVDSEVLASMRFFGCVVQAQSEAWNPDDQAYEVAVAVIWSRKLHKLALATLTGDNSVKGKPGRCSFEAWLDAQDFSSMVGSRQMTDNKGNKYFVGIGAAPYPKLIVEREAAWAMAQENARVAAMFAMLGDGASQRVANRDWKRMSNDSSYSTTKLTQNIFAEIKDQQVQGMEERDVYTLVNPISGQKMYVAVLTINPELAAQSQDMLNLTGAGVIENETSNRFRAGAEAGREAAIDAARRDPSAYQQGVQAGGQGIVDKLPTPPASMRRTGGQTATPAAAPAGQPVPQGGVYTGDSYMDMDF